MRRGERPPDSPARRVSGESTGRQTDSHPAPPLAWRPRCRLDCHQASPFYSVSSLKPPRQPTHFPHWPAAEAEAPPPPEGGGIDN